MNTELLYEEKITPEIKNALKQFWLDLAQVQEIEPAFGQYSPDLDFEVPGPGPEMSSSLTDGRKWHFAPDQHYFKAAGVVPEPARISTFRQVLIWCLAWVLVGELILILWPGVL